MTKEKDKYCLPEEPVETQALTGATKADAWVREALTPIDEELLDGILSLRDLPSTYVQAGLLYNMLPKLDEEGYTETWLDLLDVDLPSGFLFCGPPGCGKRDTAWAMLGDLRHFGYDQLIYLTGSELNLKSAKKVKKCMKSLCRYAEEGQKVVLLLDHISTCDCGKWVIDFLSEQQSDIFMILLEDEISACHISLHRTFPCIWFPLPDQKARLEFLQYYMRGELNAELLPDTQQDDLELTEEDMAVLNSDMKEFTNDMTGLGGLNQTMYQIELENITQEELAEKTEGFSYQQMKQLTDLMRFELIQMLQENTAMDLMDAANALTAGGNYRIKSYAIEKMIRVLKDQKLSGFAQMPVYIGNHIRMPQLYGENQNNQPSENITATDAEKKIMEAAKGGKKDYRFLKQYFSGSVEERFNRKNYGEIQAVYVNSKESESDLEEEPN